MFTHAQLDCKTIMYTMFTIMNKKDVILAVRVDAEIEKLVKSMAKKDDRSVSWIVRELIITGLKAKKIRISSKETRNNER